nr:unnamed protein product [Digitaria exilis]
MLHDGSSGDNAPFDINDFPQLTGRPNSAGGGQGQYGSLRKHGVSVNAIVQQNQEFSIQNEDFPALPGYKGVFSPNTLVSSSSDYAMDMHHKDHLHENVNIMQAQHYPFISSSFWVDPLTYGVYNFHAYSYLLILIFWHTWFYRCLDHLALTWEAATHPVNISRVPIQTTLFSITKQWRRDLPFLLPHKILDENYKLSP